MFVKFVGRFLIYKLATIRIIKTVQNGAVMKNLWCETTLTVTAAQKCLPEISHVSRIVIKNIVFFIYTNVGKGRFKIIECWFSEKDASEKQERERIDENIEEKIVELRMFLQN